MGVMDVELEKEQPGGIQGWKGPRLDFGRLIKYLASLF
jgi:hypothetical protein